MARWKLTEAHYLNVPGTKWEHITADRATGRQIRKAYDVPLFLHPEDPFSWNYKDNMGDGEVIVCHEGKGEPKDYVFVGDPTPGMLPLDDEARTLTAKFSSKWTPTQSSDEAGQADSFQAKLLNGLIDSMHAAQTSAAQAPQLAGLEKLLEAMASMMQQNQEMMRMLAERPRVVDTEPPLEDAEPTPEELAAAAQQASVREAESTARATSHAMKGRR